MSAPLACTALRYLTAALLAAWAGVWQSPYDGVTRAEPVTQQAASQADTAGDASPDLNRIHTRLGPKIRRRAFSPASANKQSRLSPADDSQTLGPASRRPVLQPAMQVPRKRTRPWHDMQPAHRCCRDPSRAPPRGTFRI